MTEVCKIINRKAPAIMKNLGWKLYAIELLIYKQVFQKNISIRILKGNLKKK